MAIKPVGLFKAAAVANKRHAVKLLHGSVQLESHSQLKEHHAAASYVLSDTADELASEVPALRAGKAVIWKFHQTAGCSCPYVHSALVDNMLELPAHEVALEAC